MITRFVVLIGLFIFIISNNFAQSRTDTSSITLPAKGIKSKRIFYGQPGKAALYSLILPGAGQVYNKRIWKVPLVYALEGTAVYLLLDNIKIYNKWNTCYTGMVNGLTDIPECGSVDDVSTAFRVRNSARGNRELSYIFMGAAHLLNIVEAFVDRHLINFDTSDDLTFHEPPPYQLDTQITLIRVRIPLN